MEKEFIPYEQALALKELGFDEPCFGWFTLEGDGAKSMFVPEKCPKQDIGLCLAPTFSQAFRWFREKYNLFGQVNMHTYFIYDISNDELKMVKQYDKLVKTYEEAELECLKKLIEIINERKGT